MKIPNSAALVVYSNDEDMLRMQFESGQFDFYEHIYIFDGPYSYIETLYPFLETDSIKLSEKKEWQFWLNDNRVTYDYRIYKDEYEKRTFAYDSIDKEIVVLHDTDEFYDFDHIAVSDFIDSDKSVGFFRCQNLFNNGCRSENITPATFDDLPLKAFVFKKSLVTRYEHLNYLWLVGVAQSAQDSSKQSLVPLAKGYHLTQMRSTAGQIQKFCFYSSLYASKNNIQDSTRQALEQISLLVSEGRISSQEAIYLYLSSLQHFASVHSHDSDFYFDDRFRISDKLESIISIAIDQRHKPKFGDIKIFNGMPYYFYLSAKNLSKLFLTNPNMIEISMKIFEYKYKVSAAKCVEQMVSHADIAFDFIVERDSHGFLVELLSRDSRFPALMDLNISII